MPKLLAGFYPCRALATATTSHSAQAGQQLSPLVDQSYSNDERSDRSKSRITSHDDNKIAPYSTVFISSVDAHALAHFGHWVGIVVFNGQSFSLATEPS